MLRMRWTPVLFSILWIALVGCSSKPAESQPGGETHVPPSSGARTLSVPAVGETASSTQHGPLKWDLPDGWTETAPSSNMRLAQYTVTGSAGDGECVVFYFGPGQGGDPMANAQRWAGQFSQPDGSNSLDKMTMQRLEGGTLELALVAVTGTYEGGMTAGTEPPTPEPGWMLLGGIASGPDAPWFFKLTGPQATLEENRQAFVNLLESIRQEI
jgi:hypothetical protein